MNRRFQLGSTFGSNGIEVFLCHNGRSLTAKLPDDLSTLSWNDTYTFTLESDTIFYQGRGLSVIRVADLGPLPLGLHRDMASHVRGLSEDLSVFELTFRKNWASLRSQRSFKDADCDVFLASLGANVPTLSELAVA